MVGSVSPEPPHPKTNEASMFPLSSRRAPQAHYYYPTYRSPLLWPLGSSLGFGLTAAGFMIIAHMVAPQLLEQVVPGWQQRFGLLVGIAVVFGFFRSIFRLIGPIVSLGFWAVAIFALVQTSLPGSSLLPKSLPSLSSPASPSVAPSAAAPIRLHGTPALPDSAYFPNSSSGSSSSMPMFGSQRMPAPLNAIKKLFSRA